MTLLKHAWSCSSDLYLLCFLYLIILLCKGAFSLLDRCLKSVYHVLQYKGGWSQRTKCFLPEVVLWFNILLQQKSAHGRNFWAGLRSSLCSLFPLGLEGIKGLKLKPRRSLLPIGHTVLLWERWNCNYMQCAKCRAVSVSYCKLLWEWERNLNSRLRNSLCIIQVSSLKFALLDKLFPLHVHLLRVLSKSCHGTQLNSVDPHPTTNDAACLWKV